MAAASANALEKSEPGPCDVNGEVTWFREAMTQICDVAIPRIRALPARKSVYWWSLKIAKLRATCVRERHRYTRCRRRRHTEAEAAALHVAYKETKKAPQRAIKRAKDKAWAELLETLNDDPWKRPYLIVRKRLRSGGPGSQRVSIPRSWRTRSPLSSPLGGKGGADSGIVGTTNNLD